MRTALLLVAMMAVGATGCHGSSTAEPEVFTATCEKSVGPNTYAEHDFGTTDPDTLARVVAYQADPPAAYGPDGGAATGAVRVPLFQGSVAFVDGCTLGETVTFELLP